MFLKRTRASTMFYNTCPNRHLAIAYYEGRENEAISFTLVMTDHKVE